MCYVYFIEWEFDSLILFKFWNISHFLSSSFSVMSSGWCLSSIALPSLIMHSIMLWSKLILTMPLQNPTNFLISSSFLSSGSDFLDSGSSNTIMFLLLFCLSFSSLSHSFSDFAITSSAVLFSSMSILSAQVFTSLLFFHQLFYFVFIFFYFFL